MEWDNDKCLELIGLYEIKPQLWERTHKLYHNKMKKHDAWIEIAKGMETTVDVVKAKLNSLLSSFRREKAKQEKSMTTGSGRDEVYESKWYGYRAFAFLLKKSKRSSRRTLSTVEMHLNEELVKDDDDADELPTEDEAFQDTEYLESINNSTTQESNTSASRETKARFSKHGPPKTKKAKFESTDECGERDGCDIYGEHIAVKLRSYDRRTQAVVQHLFNNILFNADMGQYDNHIPHANSIAP